MRLLVVTLKSWSREEEEDMEGDNTCPLTLTCLDHNRRKAEISPLFAAYDMRLNRVALLNARHLLPFSQSDKKKKK